MKRVITEEYINELRQIQFELSEIVFYVDQISDLYNFRINYKSAIPILINWIPKAKNLIIKEALIGAITVPWAKRTSALKMLIDEFYNPLLNDNLLWVIGNALEVIADDTIFYDLVKIIREKSFGDSRQMVVLALGKMKKHREEAIDVALEVLSTDELSAFAISALSKLKAEKAIPKIEPF